MAESKLAQYRAKRDFGKTKEPSGEAAIAPSERLRFVVQKHAARRLHYDLRLELDGVFKSWAVTRGPSLDPHDRRLAVEVEDHPLDYGDFEGTIPQGEYGGGTVQLWDRGYWEPVGSETPQHALDRGELKFNLFGQRLHGGWVLVRLKRDTSRSKRTNWLLIKHRDDFARDGEGDALLAQDRSVASGRTMEKIAAGEGRGPKPFILAARSSAAADAVWHSKNSKNADTSPGLAQIKPPRRKPETKKGAAPSVPIPDFVPPQLCTLVERPPSGGEWVHEIKFDGYRVQLRVEAGKVALRTRKGLDWTAKFRAIAREAANLDNCLIDGEIVAHDENGAPDFAALQSALSEQKTDDLVLYAFDLLFDQSGDLQPEPLSERKGRLRELLHKDGDGPLIRYVEHFATGGDAVLRSACRLSLEGIVSKRLDAPYQSGRSTTWTKAKCRAGHEVVIGGWTTTNGRFRSLLVGVNRGGQFVYIGRVGTGLAKKSSTSSCHYWRRRNPKSRPLPEAVRRGIRPISIGPGPNSSPKSNLPVGLPTAWCAKPPSRGCGRISPQPKSRPKRQPPRKRPQSRIRRRRNDQHQPLADPPRASRSSWGSSSPIPTRPSGLMAATVNRSPSSISHVISKPSVRG